ncbi:MAG TPA: carbonic anhydrase [Candidatus Cybelea sp.]|nr:carbonic anhydrase [Candidatus Cybelea sp.]
MSEPNERFRLNRAAFVTGTLVTMSMGLPLRAASAPASAAKVSPEQLLGRLMAGNRRFLNNDFPPLTKIAEKREMLTEHQEPYAVILSCADSRVVPNFVFVQGVGDLFVTRVAGNYPDDLVTGSIEYAIEHLGSRLVMVLGHENCGAVEAVYKAIQKNSPLPSHLSRIEALIRPGIEDVVRARGTVHQAVEANVRAAVARLKSSPPVIEEESAAGRVLVVGAIYRLDTGEVVPVT